MSELDLIDQLRTALTRLHDLDYLETHPLAQALADREPAEGAISRGDLLRKRLLVWIEGLKPATEIPEWAPERRRYVILYDRYVLRRSLPQIEAKLSLGDRQVRREHRRALAALAVLARSELYGQTAGAPRSVPASVQEAVQRLTPTPRAFALAPLIDEVATILAEVSHQPREILRWTVEPAELTVYTDRGILHQLLLKLLQCALRQRERTTPLELTATAVEGHVRLQIAYAATALPVVDQGLRLCHWLAEVLRGALVQRIVGPRQVELELRLPPGARLCKVLIIDDEPPAIDLFESYLSGSEYAVVGETRPERALARAVEVAPDVIVLDVMMPAMDGWELLQRLRHTPALREVPIIVCSVLDDADLAFALGAARFLKKPVLRQHLLAALGEVRPAGATSTTAETERPTGR